MLKIHSTRAKDLVGPDQLITEPWVPFSEYRDSFENICTRLVAPAGRVRIAGSAVVQDSGQPDETAPWTGQQAVPELPENTLIYLLGSRYCETDKLSQSHGICLGITPPGWARVQVDLRFRQRPRCIRL